MMCMGFVSLIKNIYQQEQTNNNSFIVLIDLTNEKIISKINTKLGKEITCIKAIDIKNEKFFICGGRWSDIILLENKEYEFNIKTRIENKYSY